MVRMMMIATVLDPYENRVTAIISSKPQNAEDGDNAFTELTSWPSLKINLIPLFDLIKGLPPPPKRKYG